MILEVLTLATISASQAKNWGKLWHAKTLQKIFSGGESVTEKSGLNADLSVRLTTDLGDEIDSGKSKGHDEKNDSTISEGRSRSPASVASAQLPHTDSVYFIHFHDFFFTPRLQIFN